MREPAAAERIAFLAGEMDRWRNTPGPPLKHGRQRQIELDGPWRRLIFSHSGGALKHRSMIVLIKRKARRYEKLAQDFSGVARVDGRARERLLRHGDQSTGHRCGGYPSHPAGR